MSKGKLIVIEGLDGSGKATQAKLLAQHLASQGLPVREVTFPDYASDSSALIKMYLAGQFGSKPDDVNAYAASSFFAVDRYVQLQDRLGPLLRGGRRGHCRPLHHLQRGAPVLQAPAGAVGGVFRTGCSITSSICWACPHRTASSTCRWTRRFSQRLMTARYHG